MIPVLIAPAYNRHDLLLRALRSIDVEVERGLVIDSGMNILDAPEWEDLTDEMERLNLYPFTPPFSSMGYGGAINFSIMQTADAPWWMWVSNDVHFLPGQLERVVARMEEPCGPRIVTSGFTWAALNRACVNEVGLIDEHGFFPIYYDDNDYHRRCALAGVEWIEDGDVSKHGDGDRPASLTIHSDDKLRLANSRSFRENARQYMSKWGGMPGNEQYPTPYNTGVPLWHVKPDVDIRRDRQW